MATQVTSRTLVTPCLGLAWELSRHWNFLPALSTLSCSSPMLTDADRCYCNCGRLVQLVGANSNVFIRLCSTSCQATIFGVEQQRGFAHNPNFITVDWDCPQYQQTRCLTSTVTQDIIRVFFHKSRNRRKSASYWTSCPASCIMAWKKKLLNWSDTVWQMGILAHSQSAGPQWPKLLKSVADVFAFPQVCKRPGHPSISSGNRMTSPWHH